MACEAQPGRYDMCNPSKGVNGCDLLRQVDSQASGNWERASWQDFVGRTLNFMKAGCPFADSPEAAQAIQQATDKVNFID